VSRCPKYFLRPHSAGSASSGSGRPVRHSRLRLGVSPQTLQTPPHGRRPVLRHHTARHDNPWSPRLALLTAPSEALPPPSATDPAWGRSDWTFTSKFSAPPGAHYCHLRLASTSRLLTGYRSPRSTRLAQPAGPERVSPVPAAPIRTFSSPLRRGVPRRLRIQVLKRLPWPSPFTAGLGTPSSPPTGRVI
jgi:hypothetical protein